MSSEPLLRHAARAVVIDDAGRTLLFRAKVPGREGRFIWITPGGGRHEGEDDLHCVRRELTEETGLTEFEVGPCVWPRDHTFRWGDGVLRQVEAYFVVRVAAFDVSTDGHEELERSFLTDHRWFSLAELEAHTETCVPADFAARLAPLIRGDYPARPDIVGV